MRRRTTLRVIEGGSASLDGSARGMTGQPLAVSTTVGAADDPIFALIEAHGRAFWKRMEAGAAYFELDYVHPKYEAGKAAHDALANVADEAAMQLIEVQPTTMAGVMALIDYVDDFNQGKFRFNDEWCSAPYNWPDGLVDDDRYSDDPDDDCGMAFAVLLNVRDALQTLAVQS
jgi:hypothetical protein